MKPLPVVSIEEWEELLSSCALAGNEEAKRILNMPGAKRMLAMWKLAGNYDKRKDEKKEKKNGPI